MVMDPIPKKGLLESLLLTVIFRERYGFWERIRSFSFDDTKDSDLGEPWIFGRVAVELLMRTFALNPKPFQERELSRRRATFSALRGIRRPIGPHVCG
jgi:hypothetical protein